MDIQGNKPYTVNQISNDKPNVPRSINVLSGYAAGSMNGGHNKTAAWQFVMAGQRIKEMRFKVNLKTLTPLTPTYQNLRCTARVYYVPHARVFTNFEKFLAQRGGASETKISEFPNIGGKVVPFMRYTSARGTNLMNTDLWRDSFISSYIPRFGQYVIRAPLTQNEIVMPKINVLPIRARVAIYNDMERNREYEEEVLEYKDDTVSDEEWKSYLPTQTSKLDFYNMRARKGNSYYTDYRTEMQGEETTLPIDNETSSTSLLSWISYEAKAAQIRAEAENAQMRDEDIIAKIRGSQKLREKRVLLVGQQTFNLNYAAITQNTYNTNENVQEQFQVMGTQGAYSYTEVNLPLLNDLVFLEEGTLHVILNVSADTVFESGVDRLLLNVSADDIYTPDLADDKLDVLYDIEMGTIKDPSELNAEGYSKIVGYKRRWSEYFKLPNVIAGDMTTKNYFQTNVNGAEFTPTETQIITNKTFQFFEEDNEFYYERTRTTTTDVYPKKIWKDYTDLMINKNLAVQMPIEFYTVTQAETEDEPVQTYVGGRVKGQNQIFFVGVITELTDMPVDEKIKGNYTTWGEH